jgi:T-complex protein 1 subunit alpha
MHDSICVAKRTLESGKVIAGGGAVDIALSIHLDQFCRTFSSKEQIAISEFSEALNIIPKTLAVNAAKDATELISKLRTLHTASQKEGETD